MTEQTALSSRNIVSNRFPGGQCRNHRCPSLFLLSTQDKLNWVLPCPVNFSSLGSDWVPTHRISPRHHQAHTGPPITHSLSLLSFTVEAMLVLLLVGKYIGDKAERERGIFLQGNPVEWIGDHLEKAWFKHNATDWKSGHTFAVPPIRRWSPFLYPFNLGCLCDMFEKIEY